MPDVTKENSLKLICVKMAVFGMSPGTTGGQISRTKLNRNVGCI